MNNEIRTSVVDLKSMKTLKTQSQPKRALGHVVLSATPRRYPAQVQTRVFVSATPTSIVRSEVVRVTLLSPWQMMLARIVAAVLVPAILLHPVARVYADEVVETTPVTIEEATPPAVEESIAIPADVAVPVEGDAVVETIPQESEVTPPAEAQNESQVEAPDSEASAGADIPLGDIVIVGGSGAGSSDVPVLEATSTDEVLPSDTPTLDDSASSTTEFINDGDATSTESLIDDGATTTDEEIAPQETEEAPYMKSAEEIAEDERLKENRMRDQLRKEVEQEFLRGCVSFEASGYYCLSNGARSQTATSAPKEVVTVESSDGVGGDKEIFVVKNGERKALTANNFDDAFPTQDASGKQFVWQGMEGGRWQIFTGSISATGTPEVARVTNSRESNFNPKIDGEHIVWQGWANENWEIFLATKRDSQSPFAGERLPEGNALLSVGPEWSVERLTDNSEHDMFPSLHGDIITWQSHEGNDWVVYAYSISAQKLTQLSSKGVKGEHPRFAITWEERDAEGNARLIGYDPSTGEKTDLTSEALKLPQAPYRGGNETPETQSEPATLPTNNGSSTPRGEDEGGGDNDVLP